MYIQIFTMIYLKDNAMTEKNAMLNIRIEASLVHDFKAMCEERGVVMSKVLRGLILDELAKYQKWTDKSKGAKNGR